MNQDPISLPGPSKGIKVEDVFVETLIYPAQDSLTLRSAIIRKDFAIIRSQLQRFAWSDFALRTLQLSIYSQSENFIPWKSLQI